MRRRTGQKALYEAWSASRSKPQHSGLVEKLRPQVEKLQEVAANASGKLKAKMSKSGTEAKPKPAPAPVVAKPPRVSEPSAPASSDPVRPKPIQINAGRVEISVPYPLGILAGLILLFALLAVFQLGQFSQRVRSAGEIVRQGNRGGVDTAQRNSVIAIVQYGDSDTLDRLKDYFNAQGIDTMVTSTAKLRDLYAKNDQLDPSVLPKEDTFFLITSTPYENPDTPGTPANDIKKIIIKLGAEYAAQYGGPLAPESFNNAHGLRIK